MHVGGLVRLDWRRESVVPVVDVAAKLVGGSYDEDSSTEMAFGVAATMACRKAAIEGRIEEGITAGRTIEASDLADAEAWYFTAANYGLLNERDGCIRCLKRAVEGGFFNYPLILRDSFFDSVRDDPEFQNILELAKQKHLSFKEKFL